MRTFWSLLAFISALSSFAPITHAACPTCPKYIPMGPKGRCELISQTSGFCRYVMHSILDVLLETLNHHCHSYYTFGFQFVCSYYVSRVFPMLFQKSPGIIPSYCFWTQIRGTYRRCFLLLVDGRTEHRCPCSVSNLPEAGSSDGGGV
jgi:hypothetical protein